MKPITRDEAFDGWTTNELTGMYRARMRALLTLEVRQAPLTLRYRQERLVRQAQRLLRARGVETPPLAPL